MRATAARPSSGRTGRAGTPTAYNGSHASDGFGRAASATSPRLVLPAAAVPALLVVPEHHRAAAAPVLLLLVLVIARVWGLGPALVAAGVGARSATPTTSCRWPGWAPKRSGSDS